MGTMTVLNQRGDVKVEWNPDDTESVEKAKKEFDQLRKAGFEAYDVSKSKKGRKITEFDPALATLTMAPGAKTKTDREKGTRKHAMAGGPVSQTVHLR